MQCNAICERHAPGTFTDPRTRSHTLSHSLEPRSLTQLAVLVVPGGIPRDPALSQGGGGGAEPLPRPAAGQAARKKALRFAIAVVVAACIVAVGREVQGAKRAPFAPSVEAAALQAVPLDFVE